MLDNQTIVAVIAAVASLVGAGISFWQANSTTKLSARYKFQESKFEKLAVFLDEFPTSAAAIEIDLTRLKQTDLANACKKHDEKHRLILSMLAAYQKIRFFLDQNARSKIDTKTKETHAKSLMVEKNQKDIAVINDFIISATELNRLIHIEVIRSLEATAKLFDRKWFEIL